MLKNPDSSPSQDGISPLIEVKLPSDALEIGMYVSRLDRPWTEVPVLMQGLKVETPDDIVMLQDHCVYVYIEIERDLWLKSMQDSGLEKKHYPGLRETTEFDEEMPRAKLIMQEAQSHVDEVLETISNGETINLDASRKIVQSCTKSILSNANALLWLTQIKNQDRYTAEHSLRVGILAITFGRFMGYENDDLELLGLCGMLHDVGKTKIPEDILNKPSKLTRIEFEIIKEHSTLGKEILEGVHGVDSMMVDTAHYHHERLDGKGYPEQISAGYLHHFIRMISIVDVYDAVSSSRPYKKSSPAFDALKVLLAGQGEHFDIELVEAFIRMVGVYPPGTLVEMTNGEIGIVVSANMGSRLRPRVELVMTHDKKLRPSYLINLLDDAVDKSGDIYVIKQGLGNGTYGVDVKDYVLK